MYIENVMEVLLNYTYTSYFSSINVKAFAPISLNLYMYVRAGT